MLRIALNYFESLFATNGTENVDETLEGVTLCITNEMIAEHTNEFTSKEVCLALKNMSPLKASGEDGLGAMFYQILITLRNNILLGINYL